MCGILTIQNFSISKEFNKMMKTKQLKEKEYTEQQLKKITGGNSVIKQGGAASNLAQCIFSLFKKC